jgi:hypothetical protein|nr:MAG TPA_asm: protein of unknown function (DUF4802) [Caudoviricetes sp.]
MALTVGQLIEKLQKVEDKNKDVFFECPDDMYSIDGAYCEPHGDIALYNHIYSDVCRCRDCQERLKGL